MSTSGVDRNTRSGSLVVAALLALAAVACSSSPAAPPTTCQKICARASGVCRNSPPANCAVECQMGVDGTSAACRPVLETLLNCNLTAQVTCDGDGNPQLVACAAAQMASEMCGGNDGGTSEPFDAGLVIDIDAGTPPGDGGSTGDGGPLEDGGASAGDGGP